MKKFFYSMLLLLAACMTATAFVSCEEENEVTEEPKPEVKEDYLAFKYWLSNDVLEIVDVTTTGIDALKFNTNATYQGTAGKKADVVVLTGKQAKDAAFTVKLTLKSNWKELLSSKEKFEGLQMAAISDSKDEDIEKLEGKFMVHIFDHEEMSHEQFEEQVAICIERMGYEY